MSYLVGLIVNMRYIPMMMGAVMMSLMYVLLGVRDFIFYVSCIFQRLLNFEYCKYYTLQRGFSRREPTLNSHVVHLPMHGPPAGPW